MVFLYKENHRHTHTAGGYDYMGNTVLRGVLLFPGNITILGNANEIRNLLSRCHQWSGIKIDKLVTPAL